MDISLVLHHEPRTNNRLAPSSFPLNQELHWGTKIDVRLTEDTLWLTQAQMCELYQTSKSNVSEHIKHIFEEGELDREVVVRKFRTTSQHGAIEGMPQTHEVTFYNLDMIIALGYLTMSGEQLLNDAGRALYGAIWKEGTILHIHRFRSTLV